MTLEMMKRNKLFNKIKRSLYPIDPGMEIVLYGSRARGDFGDESDWDILILTSVNLSKGIKKRIKDAIFDIELDAEEPISTLIYSKDGWGELEITPLYQNIKSEGVRL